ncbi:MAG: hypothetical protein QXU98_06080, partial [Candidatus Parvarchaeota archaeon]
FKIKERYIKDFGNNISGESMNDEVQNQKKLRTEKATKYWGIGIYRDIIAQASAQGFADINDYIDALISDKQKLVEAKAQITAELQKSNEILDKIYTTINEYQHSIIDGNTALGKIVDIVNEALK